MPFLNPRFNWLLICLLPGNVLWSSLTYRQMPLTDPKVGNAKAKDRPYKLSDEKGLYLLVNKNGSKYWRINYRFAGKRKMLALGVYPVASLKAARSGCDDARKLIANDIDSAVLKKSLSYL